MISSPVSCHRDEMNFQQNRNVCLMDAVGFRSTGHKARLEIFAFQRLNVAQPVDFQPD